MSVVDPLSNSVIQASWILMWFTGKITMNTRQGYWKQNIMNKQHIFAIELVLILNTDSLLATFLKLVIISKASERGPEM